jgi:hypothetical protein
MQLRTAELDRDQTRVNQWATGTDLALGGAVLFGATTLLLFFLTDWSTEQPPPPPPPHAAAGPMASLHWKVVVP